MQVASRVSLFVMGLIAISAAASAPDGRGRDAIHQYYAAKIADLNWWPRVIQETNMNCDMIESSEFIREQVQEVVAMLTREAPNFPRSRFGIDL